MEQSALTTLTPPFLNLNSTAIEIPLTFKQDELSEEFSYTGFVPVELPYYIDSDDAIVKRWEIICPKLFKLAVRLRTSKASKNRDFFCPAFSYFFCCDWLNYCFSLLLGVLEIIFDKCFDKFF